MSIRKDDSSFQTELTELSVVESHARMSHIIADSLASLLYKSLRKTDSLALWSRARSRDARNFLVHRIVPSKSLVRMVSITLQLRWMFSIGLVLLGLASAAAGTVSTWNSCGGSQFCPCGTLNCDQQWPNQFCKEWDTCTRKDQTWWRCEPRQNACFKTMNTWEACGGGTCGRSCDAPWGSTCCKHGDVCTRKNASWWRCEPAQSYYDGNVCWAFAATWAPCSTANKRCCADPEDACVYKDASWSRCEPKSGRAAAQPPRGRPPPPLAVGGNRIVRQDTREAVKIHGLNWFGFNVARTAVDGLAQSDADGTADFATIVYQQRMLGYNTVRLPFRYLDLDQYWPINYNRQCWHMDEETLRRRLMEPGTWTDKQIWPNDASPGHDSGRCNSYLPNVDTYNRLMYTLQVFIANGIYVILDYQPMNTEPQAYSIREFVCKWRVLMSRVMALPNFEDDIKGRIFVDIMNEPDSMGIQWAPANNKPGAAELYLQTMDALHELASDSWLYIVEGTGQNMFGLNWGNGFITDKDLISKYGLSDANVFFSVLWDKPYVDKVVMSPHVYPPSITRNTFLGQTLWQQCAIAFGYLENRGYCRWPGQCRHFPIIIGETGSFLHDELDRQWMQDFADYVEGRGGARSYTSSPMAGWLWWCFNENSGDTGGIVKENWTKLDWTKLRLMIDQFGLWPWYKW